MKIRHSGVPIISINRSDRTDFGVLRMLLVIRTFYDNINDSVLDNKYYINLKLYKFININLYLHIHWLKTKIYLTNLLIYFEN